MKKNCKKEIKKTLKLVIKKNSYKLYIPRKECNSCFNSCIDKKGIIQMSKFSKTEMLKRRK